MERFQGTKELKEHLSQMVTTKCKKECRLKNRHTVLVCLMSVKNVKNYLLKSFLSFSFSACLLPSLIQRC